jgi:hypothetical protein
LKRVLRVFIWLGIGVVVLCLVGGIWLWLSIHGARQRVEEMKAAIHAAGEPVTFAEVVPPPVPDDENAAFPLREAFAILQAAEEDNELEERLESELVADPWVEDDDLIERARTWLRERAGVEMHVAEALRRPRCRFDETWISIVEQMREEDAGVDADVNEDPHAGFRRLLLWWQVEAALAAREGRCEDALDRIEDALGLTSRAFSGDLFIPFLTQRTGLERVLHSLEAVAWRCPLSDARRERLREVLGALDEPEALRRAMVSERAQGIDIYENLDAIGANAGSTWTTDLFFSHDEERFLELSARALTLAEQPYHQAREAWEGWTRRLRDGPWWAVLSRMAVVPHPIVVKSDAELCALVRLARLGLAFDAARREDGSLPDALCETVDVIDPFSGRPMQCQRTEDGGYVLSSAEEDADLLWRVAGNLHR